MSDGFQQETLHLAQGWFAMCLSIQAGQGGLHRQQLTNGFSITG